MAKYFTISHGLRGAYTDGDSYVIRATTRRELKAAIACEAANYKDAGFIGASKRGVAYLAAVAWREAHKPRPAVLPYCLPLAPDHSRKNYAFGIFVSSATRAEFLEYQGNAD